jgi:type IV pilus assembly protein PilV
MKYSRSKQHGASLIEVLISVLILSFGMLSLGGMMIYAIQMPKLAAYRATATTQGAAFVERMRANKAGFAADNYASTGAEALSYNKVTPDVYTTAACVYPNCTAQQIADFDAKETLKTLRRELSALSGMRVVCSVSCQSFEGDLWVMWDEPSQLQGLSFSSADECPDPTATPAFAGFNTPKPRCLHIKFKL